MVLKIPKNVDIYNFQDWLKTKDNLGNYGVKKWINNGGNSRGWIVLGSVIEWIFFGGDVLDWINNNGDAKLWIDFLGNVDMWLSNKGTVQLWYKNKGNIANWITYNGDYNIWLREINTDFYDWINKYKLDSWIDWKLSGGNLDSWCWISKKTNKNINLIKNGVEYEYNISKQYLELLDLIN